MFLLDDSENTLKEKIVEEIKYQWKRIRRNIREYYEFLIRWISYYKVLRKSYDFDYSSILLVERHQLDRVQKCISKYKRHLYWERDDFWMCTALALLDIISTQDGGAVLVNPSKIDSDRVLKTVEESKWEMPIYVNTRNASRFVNEIMVEHLQNPNDPIRALHLEYLRIQKAWKLYYKIREQYTRSWWD